VSVKPPPEMHEDVIRITPTNRASRALNPDTSDTSFLDIFSFDVTIGPKGSMGDSRGQESGSSVRVR
jgi:hypothetical protein